MYAVGEFCTEESLSKTKAPTREDSLEESRFFIGAIEKQEIAADSLRDNFSITFDPPAWQYSWKSNRWSPSTRHVFVVYVFLDGRGDPILHTISNPFSVISARRFGRASPTDTGPLNETIEAKALALISKSRKQSVSKVIFPEGAIHDSTSPSILPSTRRSTLLKTIMTSAPAISGSASNEMNIVVIDSGLSSESESDVLMRGDFLTSADMSDPINWESVMNPTTDLWRNDRPSQGLFSFSKTSQNLHTPPIDVPLPSYMRGIDEPQSLDTLLFDFIDI